MTFIFENLGTIITFSAVCAVIIFALIKIKKDRKKGCGGVCSECHGGCCEMNKKENQP